MTFTLVFSVEIIEAATIDFLQIFLIQTSTMY